MPGILISLSTDARYIVAGYCLNISLVGTCGVKNNNIGQGSVNSCARIEIHRYCYHICRSGC